nr:hypothetical protein [Tanacetum cinerariifolium]
MGYEHLSIIPETESDEVTKSNDENLLSIPSKCEVTLEDEIECDIPAKDDSSPVFNTFSNPLFKDNDDLESSDDESLPDEDVPAEEFKIYSNPLFDEDEINSDKLYPHCFNVKYDFVESLLNRDTFIDFFSKFDFSELNAEIANTIIESIPLPIPVQDGNSQQEEIDIVTETDDALPPSIENFVDDPEGDIRFLEELLINNSILSDELSDANFKENPSIPRPPPKSPDVETDAGEEIPVVMNDKDEDVDYSSFIFVIYPEMFPFLLSAESEDTIFDPDFLFQLLSLRTTEYRDRVELTTRIISQRLKFSCVGIFVRFPRSSYPLIDSSLGKSISFDLYCLAVIFPHLCSNCKH